MSGRSCFLILFVLLVGAGGQSFAATINWTNADPNDNLWRRPGNWDIHKVPGAATLDQARIGLQGPDACVIDSSHTGANAAETERLLVGRTAAGEMTMTGGDLTVHNFKVGNRALGKFYMDGGTVNTHVFDIAKDGDADGSFMTMTGGVFRAVKSGGGSGQFQIGVTGGSGTLNMQGGTLEIGDRLEIGKTGSGVTGTGLLTMTGGVIDIDGVLKIGVDGSTGTLQLYGGTISAGQLLMENVSGADPYSVIDITAGMLILDGDVVDMIVDYATDPNIWIVADGGSGNLVVDYDIRYPGKTTVTATSNDISLPQLTINVEPNDIGIEDSIVPSMTEAVYYWQDEMIGIGVGSSAANCPYVYRFDHWVGDVGDAYSASTTVLMDSDKTVTVVFVKDEQRVCGDVCHPIPVGDITGDCRVNIDDFAIYAEAWLNCTHPDCDEL